MHTSQLWNSPPASLLRSSSATTARDLGTDASTCITGQRERPSRANVVFVGNNGRSLYGAPWLQPVASSGKQWQVESARKPQEHGKTVAADCDQLPIGAHGKEGSPVRVRKRALDMPASRGLRFSGGLARSVACGYARASSSLFAPSTRIRLQTAKKASASWNRAKTFTASGPSGIEGVASRS
jgi:hypothetical protein